MTLKWRNAGQACISANRVYVQAGAHDKFAAMFVEKTSKLNIGHGAAPNTTFGAVTTPVGLEKAEAQVQDAVSRGAKLALGSGKPFAPAGQGSGGYFMEPVVLTNMDSSMKMSCEETFGPVCGLFKFDTEDEAIKLANDTSMGLASYAFTKNADRLWRMFEKLEAGMIGLVSCLPIGLLEARLIFSRTLGMVLRPRARLVESRRVAMARRAVRMWLLLSI